MIVIAFARRAVTALLALCLLSVPAYAAGEMPSLVHDIGVALLLSGLLAVVFTRARVPAIAGFILGGIIAGPLGLGWVTNPANIDTIAQLGFVLLLFMIGLEIDFGKIAGGGRTIVLSGILQFPLTLIFGLAVAKLIMIVGLGGTLLDSNLAAFYVGTIIAGSSTLLVVKLFQETFELDTVPGRLSLALLVFQDIWMTIFILLQPNLETPSMEPIMGSFLGIAILAAVAFAVSRTLLPSVFHAVAKVPEVVLMGAIGWCFAVVFAGIYMDIAVTRLTGVELHLAVGSGMGALIAGATIASLPYSHEIMSKVGVVKDFFVTLFFVGLGLSIPRPDGVLVLLLAVVIAVVAIVARQLVMFPILYWTGTDQRNAEVTSVRLAQISEFGLVIAFLGVQYGHLSQDLASTIIFAFVLTALATPLLYKAAYRVHDVMKPVLRATGFGEPEAAAAAEDKEWRLVMLGFHRVASSLLYDLARSDPDLIKETLVVDFNVALHERIRHVGAHVEYGDLANAETLMHAGVDRAHVVVSTVPDDLMRGIDNRHLVQTVRRMNPKAIIIANAVTYADTAAIYEAGADYVFLGRLETARGLGEAIGQALNGSLAEYRTTREELDGNPQVRRETLP